MSMLHGYAPRPSQRASSALNVDVLTDKLLSVASSEASYEERYDRSAAATPTPFVPKSGAAFLGSPFRSKAPTAVAPAVPAPAPAFVATPAQVVAQAPTTPSVRTPVPASRAEPRSSEGAKYTDPRMPATPESIGRTPVRTPNRSRSGTHPTAGLGPDDSVSTRDYAIRDTHHTQHTQNTGNTSGTPAPPLPPKAYIPPNASDGFTYPRAMTRLSTPPADVPLVPPHSIPVADPSAIPPIPTSGVFSGVSARTPVPAPPSEGAMQRALNSNDLEEVSRALATPSRVPRDSIGVSMREDAYTDEATQMSPWGREFRSRNGVPDTMEAMQEQQRALLEHRDRAHQQPHAHGDRSEPNSNSRSRTKRKDAKMEAMEAAVRNLQAKMLAERQERIRLERDAGAGAQKAACYKKQLHTAAEALRRHKETAQVKENERHRLQYAFEEAKDRAIRYEEALRVRDARDIGRDEGRREAWQEAERWLGAGAEQVAPLGQSLNHFVPDSHDMPQPHPHQQPNHHMNMNMNMPPQNMGMNMNMNIPPNQNMPPQFPQQQMPPNINIVPPQMGYPGPGPGPGGMDMNHNTAQMTQHQYEQHQIDQQRMEQQFGQQPMQGMQPGLQPGGPFPQQVHPTPRGERDQYFEMRDAAAAQEAQEATLAPIVAYTPMGSVIRADELEEDQRALYATPSQGGPSEAAAYAAAIAAESHAGRMSRKASNYALSAATPSVAPTGPVSVAPLPVAASGLAPGNHGASLAASRPSSRLPSIAPTAPSLAWEKDPSYAASVAPTAAGVGLGINPAQYPLPPSRMTSVPPSVWNQPSAAPSAYAPSQMNPANYPPPPLVMTSAPAPSTQWNGEAHSVQPVVAVQPSPVQVVGAHLNPAQHPLPPSILSSAPHSNVAQTVVSASNSGWPFVQAVPSQVPSFIPATKAVSSTPSAKAPTVAPSLAPVNPANVRLPSSAPSSGGRSAGTAHPARIPPPSVAPSGRQPNARPASSVAPSFRPASMAPSVNPANIRLPSSTATPYPSAGAAPSLAPSVVAAKPPSAAPAAYQASARAPSVAPRAAPRASNGRPASVMEVLDADANKPLPIPTGIQQGRPMSITSGPQKRSSSQPPVIHAHAHQHTGSASFENRYPIFPGSRAEERPGEPEDPHIIDPLEPIDPAQLVYKAKPVVQRSERSEKNDREPIDAQVNTKRYSRPPTVHSVAATSAARSRIAEALRDGTDISPRPDPAAAARPPSMYSQAQGRPRAASETRWGGPAPGAPSALGLTGLEDEHQHYDGRGTRAPTIILQPPSRSSVIKTPTEAPTTPGPHGPPVGAERSASRVAESRVSTAAKPASAKPASKPSASKPPSAAPSRATAAAPVPVAPSVVRSQAPSASSSRNRQSMPPAPVAAPAVSLTRSRPASVAVSQAPAGHSAGHSRAASGSIARVPVPSVKGPSKAPTAKASTTAAPSAKAPSAAPKAPTAVPSKAPSKVPSAVPTEKAPTQPAPAPRRRLSTETAGVDFQGWLEKSRDAGAPPAYVPDCASVATAGRLATAREPAALSTLDRAVATRLPSSRAAGSVAGSASVSGSASVVSRPPRAPYPPSFYSARHRPSQIVLPAR